MSIHAAGPLDIESLSAEMADPVRAKVEEAAAWRGVPVASFVIEAASRAADEVIERERLIQLTRADAEQILNLLDNPPEPNASLLKAAEAHQRLIRG